MENLEQNGFVFNAIRDLIDEPENPSLQQLRETLDALYKQKEYIAAARVQHRINSIVLG